MESSAGIERTPSSLVAPAQLLVATDLTDTEKLVACAIAQAHCCGARVSLVHAIDSFAAQVARDSERLQVAEANARAVMGEMARRLEQAGVACSVTVKRGLPTAVIGDEIERTGATRLLIGTHAHGDVGQTIIGTVANALLVAARVPVFVIGPQARVENGHTVPHKILHPVSLAGRSNEGVRFALELARSCESELTLLHVMGAGVTRSPYRNGLAAQADRELAALVPAGYARANIHRLLEYGDPVQEVLRVAQRDAVDWIVMGIERDFPWWSMKNNAAYQVIADAECPVLVVGSHVRIGQATQPTATAQARIA